jgi:hypothetical protein
MLGMTSHISGQPGGRTALCPATLREVPSEALAILNRTADQLRDSGHVRANRSTRRKEENHEKHGSCE